MFPLWIAPAGAFGRCVQGAEWRKLDDKAEYNEKAEELKAEYKTAMKAYEKGK